MEHVTRQSNRALRSARGEEGGFVMIAAMLVMVMVTGLASAAMIISNMDITVATGYRTQRTGEVVADGGIELVKAMIYGQDLLLNLPLSIPTDGTASTWSQTVNYDDGEMQMAMTIRYKQEDNINFNTTETYADEVVRYGKDYNFNKALKLIGKQPVYSVTVSESRTGTKAEADLISSIGFRTPGALFVQGAIKMYKYYYVTDESIEITSASDTPAVATAAATVTIEKVKEAQSITATQLLGDVVAGAGTVNVASTSDFPASGQLAIGAAIVSYTGKVDNTGSGPNQFTGCTGTPAATSGTRVDPVVATTLSAAAAANSASITVGSVTGFPGAGSITVNGVAYAYTSVTSTAPRKFNGLGTHPAWGSGTGVAGPYFSTAANFTGYYNNSGTDGTGDDSGRVCLEPYGANNPSLHNMVYSSSQVLRAKRNGYLNEAREMSHILMGVGQSRFADLNAAYTAAGGGSAGTSAANALFKYYTPAASDSSSTVAGGGYAASEYDVTTAFTPSTYTAGVLPTCSGLVCVNYPMPPATTASSMERMMGATFADLQGLADTTISCATSQTYYYPVSGSKTNAKSCNMTTMTGAGLNLGTPDDPQVIFISSPGASPAAVGITTTNGTQVSGYGVLIIDGDADIAGSFNWTGLMLVKGKLSFVPYAGGTVTDCTSGGRSGSSLATRWNGFLMVGGDMYLWTYTGGSIVLGYEANDLATINMLISNAVPSKVLAWRRSYN